MASSFVAWPMMLRVVAHTTLVRSEDHFKIVLVRVSVGIHVCENVSGELERWYSCDDAFPGWLPRGVPKTRKPCMISPGVNVLMALARDAFVWGRGEVLAHDLSTASPGHFSEHTRSSDRIVLCWGAVHLSKAWYTACDPPRTAMKL
eukprot:scaffold170988_cov92-Attheya_sp.AAC.1